MGTSKDADGGTGKSAPRPRDEALGVPSLKKPPEFLEVDEEAGIRDLAHPEATAPDVVVETWKEPWKEPSVKEPWKEPSVKEPWKEPSIKEPWKEPWKEPAHKVPAHKDPRLPKPPTGKWSPNQS